MALVGFDLDSFALKNQFVLGPFFDTFVESKGLTGFGRSILTSFAHFTLFLPFAGTPESPSPAPIHGLAWDKSYRLAWLARGVKKKVMIMRHDPA